MQQSDAIETAMETELAASTEKDQVDLIVIMTTQEITNNDETIDGYECTQFYKFWLSLNFIVFKLRNYRTTMKNDATENPMHRKKTKIMCFILLFFIFIFQK